MHGNPETLLALQHLKKTGGEIFLAFSSSPGAYFLIHKRLKKTGFLHLSDIFPT
jgi:hypothetical protein